MPELAAFEKGWPRKLAAKTGLHVYTRRLYMCAVHQHAQDISDAVFDTVVGGQGSFTAKEAGDFGCPLGSQAHHVNVGNWVRVERGSYRGRVFRNRRRNNS